MSHAAADPDLPPADPADLREPAHRVSPRAVGYWRTHALIGLAVVLAIATTVMLLVPERPWWAWLIAVLVVGDTAVYAVLMPRVRYRVHRWEVTATAIHTRAGWISVETRIAPLSRVQTVESRQGALMRLFRLASLKVTTASAAGPISIDGLDQQEARELVAQLTAVTGATEGDAT